MIDITRVRRRTLGTVAAIAAAATCAALVPAGAQAAVVRPAASVAHPAVVHPEDGSGETDTTTPLWYDPTTADGWYVELSSGNWIDIHCWIDAASYDGTNRWFEVDYYGYYYFVSADQIINQPSVGKCS